MSLPNAKPESNQPIQEHERKAWHPVVWQQPPPKVEEILVGADAPHKRIIRNIYRFFEETKDKPEVRKKHIEDMLLSLPSASKTS